MAGQDLVARKSLLLPNSTIHKPNALVYSPHHPHNPTQLWEIKAIQADSALYTIQVQGYKFFLVAEGSSSTYTSQLMAPRRLTYAAGNNQVVSIDSHPRLQIPPSLSLSPEAVWNIRTSGDTDQPIL